MSRVCEEMYVNILCTCYKVFVRIDEVLRTAEDSVHRYIVRGGVKRVPTVREKAESLLPNRVERLNGFVHLPLAKQQRYAPKSCQTHQSVYYPAYRGSLSAEYPSNYIEAEYTDAAPVERSDNYESERNAIKNHSYSFLRSARFKLGICGLSPVIFPA